MTVAAVELWGTRIGAVALTDSTGVAAFEYEPAFLASGIQLAPLMMPLEERVYSFPELPRRTFRGLPGLLADSLPDRFGNNLINCQSCFARTAPSLSSTAVQSISCISAKRFKHDRLKKTDLMRCYEVRPYSVRLTTKAAVLRVKTCL